MIRGVNNRQHRQERRIEQGVRSGELTHQEAKGWRKEERNIRREERAFKSDGKLTRAESASWSEPGEQRNLSRKA